MKTAHTIRNDFSYNMHKSSRTPSLSEPEDGKEVLRRTFTEFFKGDYFERYTPKRAVSAEHFDRTIHDLLKAPVCNKSTASWIDEEPKKNLKN